MTKVLCVITFALTLVMGTIILNTPMAAAEVTYPERAYIFINPAATFATFGQTFIVYVMVNASSFWDISQFDITVLYDNTLIEVVSVAEGNFLKQHGEATWGWIDTDTPGIIWTAFTKLENPIESGGVDTLLVVQFKVNSQSAISSSLMLQDTHLGLWPKLLPWPLTPPPPWDAPTPELPYDPNPTPPALPYSHYTLDGVIALNTNIGDINNDGEVGLTDLVSLADAYGSKPADANWNHFADIAEPFDSIGLTDLVTLAYHYGEHYQ